MIAYHIYDPITCSYIYYKKIEHFECLMLRNEC